MIEHITQNLLAARDAINWLLEDRTSLEAINGASKALIQCFEQGNMVFSCGNGGSMCDAMHFAEELTGQFRKRRRGFAAVAICDPSHISCVANDFGYEEIFARYIAAHGKRGDCLLAISTSGNSKNVLRAVEQAKSMGITVIGLSGRTDSNLARQADISICTPVGDFADRAQELHIKIIHILIELVERHFCAENYA